MADINDSIAKNLNNIYNEMVSLILKICKLSALFRSQDSY